MKDRAYARTMDFRVLGPVVAFHEARELKLGGPKQRLVLAMLLAAHGKSVSTGVLIDGLWGEDSPSTARKMLQGYIHYLRGEVGDALVTDPGGYSLHVGADQVDERRFEGAVLEAEPLIPVDPIEASERLAEALALWRGNPYADLDGEMVLQPELTRLGELRLVALSDRIDADLAIGRHEMLIGELESLTVEYPLREKFRAQLMLALYRSGRQGEALRAFAHTRDSFIEEMGIEPSDELADLEDRMLRRDPSLDIAPQESAGSARALRGYELRETVSVDAAGTLYRAFQRSVGREVAIRVMEGARANDPAFIARFQSDTARVAKLNHPNIVYVQDAWREPGRVYEVTQWIEGERLDSYLASNRAGQTTAIRWIEQIGGALATAHRVGVVHGDVSGRNVLVSETGDVFLTDFMTGAPPSDESDDRRRFISIAHQLMFGAPPVISDRGFEALPSSATPSGLARVFEEALSVEGFLPVQQFVRNVKRAVGNDVVELAEAEDNALSLIRNPYKGLQAFQTEDARDFFGRDSLIERMLARFREKRLVAIVGPSGSGKSSVLKAGLAPRLDGEGQPFLLAEMYPGSYPFEELEGALAAIAVSDAPMSDQLVSDERGLVRVLQTVLPTDNTELVLAIDQFEELFSMTSSEPIRALFLDSLVAAVSDPRSRLRVVLTLRADFFDRPLRYPGFGTLVEAGLVPVTMPDESGIAAVIEGPANAVGLTVEPGLIAQMVRDVSHQPGGLPLLQYALTELFERRTSNQLTLDTYQKSGGVLGALATRAEQLYTELTPKGQEAIRQAFARLISVGDDADDVRRRVTRSELLALEVDKKALAQALQTFAAHRLLTFDSDPVSRAPTVEVAHEALLREWGRLRDWIDELRDDLVFRRRMDSAIREWEGSDKSQAYLLAGGRLAQFDEWAGTSDLALSSRERGFLQASRDESHRVARRSASIRRRVMSALLAAALLAAAFGVVAALQANRVADQAYEAETARLGQEAGFVADWNQQLSLLMAVETFKRDPGFEGLNALQRVLVEAGPFLGVLAGDEHYRDVYWPAENVIVASNGGEVHLLNVSEGTKTVLPIDVVPPDPTSNPLLSPATGIRAGSRTGLVLVTDANGDLVLVDTTDASVRRLDYGRAAQSAAISDDGALIAVGYPGGTLEIRNAATGELLTSVLAHPPRTQTEADFDGLLDPCEPSVTRLVGIGLCDSGQHTESGRTGVNWLVFDRPPSSTGSVGASRRIISSSGFSMRAWAVDDLSPLGPEITNTWGTDELNQYAQYPRHFWFEGSDALVSAGDTFVSRWQISTGEQLSLATVPTGPGEVGRGAVGMAAAMPGPGGRIISLTNAGQVTSADIGDLVQGRPLRVQSDTVVMSLQLADPSAMTRDPSSSRFAVASAEGILVASLDGRRLLAESHDIGATVQPSISRDGLFVTAGLVSEGIWDISQEPPVLIPVDINVEVAQFAGSAATFRFVPARHRDVILWTSDFVERSIGYDLATGEYLGDYWGSLVPAWSDDGSLVARVVPGLGSRVEPVDGGEPLYTSSGLVRSADFDSSGSRALLTFVSEPDFASTTGLLLDLKSGDEVSLPGMPGGVFAASFTPDDSQIVAIGGDGAVWALDALTMAHVRDLQDAGPASQLLAPPPEFSPDGAFMVSATDGQARMWHLESGRQVGVQFPTSVGGLPYGVSSEEGLRLVTPFGGKALVWNLDTTTWVDIACRAAGRNMTRSEWRLFGPQDSEYDVSCEQFAAAPPTPETSLVAEPLPPVVTTLVDASPEARVSGESAQGLPGQGITVRPGRASWSTGYFQAAVYAALLEELGYNVSDPALNEYSPTDAYVAMAEGIVDFWPNSWYSQHLTWHDQEISDGSRAGEHLVVIGSEMLASGLEGIVVTKAVADEYNIVSLAQINDDPTLAALFDVDGNGIGDIFGCPESWTCDNLIDEILDSNNWTNLEQVTAGYGGMVEASIGRVNSGEPMLQYTWSPSSYLSSLIPGENVLWLSLGSNDAVLDGTTASGVDFSGVDPAPLGSLCSQDPCWLGWEAADVVITANRDFLMRNPAAAALFDVVELPVGDVSAQNARYEAGENTEDDLRRHAQEWIDQNRSVVDAWIGQAITAAS